MVRESKGISISDSFWMVEKNPPLSCLSVPRPVVDGKLGVPLDLVSGFCRRTMSETVDIFEIHWARFAEEARVPLWSR